MKLRKQSSTAQPLEFLMVSSTDHIAGVTGLTPTVTLSKNGGSFASPSGAISEIGNGWYKIAGNATDNNTLGPLILHATGTGADPCDTEFEVVAFDPQDTVRLGLTALPNAAAEAPGGLFTRGSGAGQIAQDANGRVSTNLVAISGSAVDNTSPQLGVNLCAIHGDSGASQNAEKYFDGTGFGEILVRTVISSLSSQTSFVLSAGATQDDAYNNRLIIIEDNGDSTSKCVASISDYTGDSKTVTLAADPGIFTMAAGDIVTILAVRSGTELASIASLATEAELAKVPKSDSNVTWNATALASINTEADTALSDYGALKPTTAGRTLDVTATGAAGIDLGNAENQSTTLSLSGTTIKEATDVQTTLTNRLVGTIATGTHNPQSGDSYAIVNSGTHGNEALKTLIDAIDDFVDTEIAAIKAKTDNLPSDPADASDISAAFGTVNTTLSTIAGYIDTEVAAIKAKTDNLPSDPADASDIAASFSSIASTLSTIASYIDTEVAAIKAKTDNLPSDPADQSAVEAAITAAVAGLATTSSLNAVASNVADILADTGTDGVVVAAGSKTGYALTSGERDSIAAALLDLAAGVETNRTLRQALRLILAASAGKLSGAASTTVVIRDTNDSKDRITATVDADGNRIAITLDAT